MYGRSDGGGRVGRLGSRSSVIPAGDPLEEPITEQTHFGKRMGANLFYREDLTVFGNGGGQRPKHSSSKTNANSSSSHLGIGTGKERGIYKTELLEKESNSSQIGGFNYRKKSANHNTPTNSEPMPGNRDIVAVKSNASLSCSQEGIIATVAEQLKMIQETQDDILDSLKHDIEIIQTENILLRQNNARLQSQVSQMNQLVADLSFDLRQMRDMITTKQQLGISLPLSDLNATRSGRKGRGNMGGEFKEESSPAVLPLTPSQGSINLRARLKRSNQRTSLQKTKSGTTEKTLVDEGRGRRAEAEKKRGKRSRTRESLGSTASTAPPQQSSCFGSLFSRRKKWNRNQTQRRGDQEHH